ncbi:MAG: bifunctional metallophosphatase/5'-nucleotidase [Sandaracinaceae bacterium]|nr:bifunctional metallophosphatase/5'-nucleotidase [Sandaracinaceae bacterium]
MRILSTLALILVLGCGSSPAQRETSVSPATSAATNDPAPAVLPSTVVISLVGTNDLHGHIGSLPILAGYLRNLRAARERDGGRVVLLDGGDLFQGTLESNMNEGAAVIEGYNALDYDAVAVGNHEFDFGPVGERATPRDPNDNPRGALFARIAEANFPFLSANLVENASGALPSTPNLRVTTMIDASGVQIGVIGLSTEATAHTTIAANFQGLTMQPLESTVVREAAALRAAGAKLVFVTAHAGGICRSFDDPLDISSCNQHEEIVDLVNALPAGTIDAAVAGHTHAGMAHIIHGVPVIESLSGGVAFGRIDFTVERASGRILSSHVFAPEHLCDVGQRPRACSATTYEGASVQPDAVLRAALEPRFAEALSVRNELLHVQLSAPFRRSHDSESPLGNLLSDWMLATQRGADVAIVNGGGIRADFPEGVLTYGALYETFPFDNRFALVTLTGAQLRRILADNVTSNGSLLSVGGVTVNAECHGRELRVDIARANGRPVRDSDRLTIATSDFLATGGDRALTAEIDANNIRMPDDGPNIRDAIAAYLRSLPAATVVQPDNAQIYSREHPRWHYAGERPVRCPR